MENVNLVTKWQGVKAKIVKFAMYLPAIVFGVLLVEANLQLFSYTANHMLRYLQSVPNYHINSIENLWLILHDVTLIVFLSFVFYFSYRKLLAKFPDNLLSALLMQFPMLFVCFFLISPTFDFSSLFAIHTSVTPLVASSSVLLLYGFNRLIKSKVTHLS
ncbi:hypothetical protein FM038_024795 [Shewanella eurypsychrophilus]|uniref:DUF2569 domain-containing protein n=1 Tax=Shewanella eurypsychrophilus TaxID=2593656 RepID=A0ABX6VFG3_9GAMM|nr:MULTISPECIES: hypothetical protein [Shewanella]QFU25022.1 hypothetical protein FS418_26420 [Shewanella sp. YLB-09]QPG60198.1 hypothetical protein FM038_024795 [Shewanella eurypsychrophilus]